MARTGHVFSLRVPTFAQPFDRADAHKVHSNGSQALFRWCPVRLGVVRYKVPGVLTAVFRHRMPPEDYAEFLAWKASQQATTPVPSQPVDDERSAVVRKLEGGANAGRSFRAMLDKVPLDGVATVKFYAKVFPSDSKFQPKVLKLAEKDASELTGADYNGALCGNPNAAYDLLSLLKEFGERTVRHKEAEKEKERLAKLKAELEAGEQRLRQLDSQVEDDSPFAPAGQWLGGDPVEDEGDDGDEDDGADEAEEEEAYQPVSPAYLPSGGAKTKPVNINGFMNKAKKQKM